MIRSEPTKIKPYMHPKMIVTAFGILTFVAVTKTILTKAVFINVATPVIFSTISCVSTAICMTPVFYCQPLSKPNEGNINGILLASIMITLDLAFTNIALAELSIPLQQCIRASAPATTILFESMFQKTIHHPLLYIIVLIICSGPIIMEIEDVSISDDKRTGIMFMILAVISGSLKNVFAHHVISNVKNEMGILSFTYWIEIICAGILIPWCFIGTELDIFLHAEKRMMAITVIVALYGGIRIMSQFFFLKHTSPTALSLSNICIQLFTVLGGILIFDNTFSSLEMIGILVTLFFSSLYTYLKLTKRFEICDYPKKYVRISHDKLPLTEAEE